MSHFKKGFEKNAGLSALLGTLAFSPIQKRLGEHVFELSKRKAMGLDVVKNSINPVSKAMSKAVDKDLDFVEKLPSGFRKKFNNYMMFETPLMATYYPAQNGRNAGKNLAAMVKKFPGNKEKYKSILADLTSPMDSDVLRGRKDLQELKKKIVLPVALGSLGVLGGSGFTGYEISQIRTKKREGNYTPPLITN
jgi:hypothetical protein